MAKFTKFLGHVIACAVLVLLILLVAWGIVAVIEALA